MGHLLQHGFVHTSVHARDAARCTRGPGVQPCRPHDVRRVCTWATHTRVQGLPSHAAMRTAPAPRRLAAAGVTHSAEEAVTQCWIPAVPHPPAGPCRRAATWSLRLRCNAAGHGGSRWAFGIGARGFTPCPGLLHPMGSRRLGRAGGREEAAVVARGGTAHALTHAERRVQARARFLGCSGWCQLCWLSRCAAPGLRC